MYIQHLVIASKDLLADSVGTEDIVSSERSKTDLVKMIGQHWVTRHIHATVPTSVCRSLTLVTLPLPQ